MNDIAPAVLSIPETAVYLSVSKDTVRRLITRGDLAHARVGNSIRLRRADVDAFLEQNTSTKWTRVDDRGRPRKKLALVSRRS